MHRVFLLMAMTLALGVPSRAAERAPVPQPKLIARIDNLFATRANGKVAIQAKGAVSGGGWRGARLRPVRSGPADARTIVVEFIATPPPPTRAVITGLLPVAAGITVPMRRGVVSVRVVSGSNEITTQILKQ